MTIFSAREQLARLDTMRGYCTPLAIDSQLKHRVLDREWYERCREAHHSSEPTAGSELIRALITDFFKNTYANTTKNSPIANFSAFGGSPQPYFPDVEYPDPEANPNTWKRMRLRKLLEQARDLRCTVLFDVESSRGHSLGLDLVDPGGMIRELNFNAAEQYIIRDYAMPISTHTYSIPVLAAPRAEATADMHIPLPDVHRPYFPEGQTSWNLMVLPPEPGN